MGKRARGAQGLSSKALRELHAAARKAVRTEEPTDEEKFDEHASAVAQRVYNAARESRASGEAGGVSPLLWAPLAVAAEMMAAVVMEAYSLPGGEETAIDVAAYFVAGFLSGGHGFDVEHFEAWRGRPSADAAEVEPG